MKTREMQNTKRILFIFPHCCLTELIDLQLVKTDSLSSLFLVTFFISLFWSLPSWYIASARADAPSLQVFLDFPYYRLRWPLGMANRGKLVTSYLGDHWLSNCISRQVNGGLNYRFFLRLWDGTEVNVHFHLQRKIIIK